ncbi:MAG: glutamyl-tRNA reductase [Deltaproteobacteria bacterium]|nr:glutamyl-tRNA reductase [Deltaproteobacteria bacterium]
MNLILVGLNHKSAPVEIREKLSYDSESLSSSLKDLISNYGVSEGVILSTCNRVEIIGVVDDLTKGAWEIKKFMAESRSIAFDELEEHLYVHTGEDAVRHIFRVSCGLDSMVMGEPQILGQVKDAYAEAIHHKSAGVIINRLYHKAFNVAKKVRTETKIGASAVSISFAAVELARKIFQDLSGKRVMLVGAGEMAELAAKHLLNSGVEDIIVANRTLERAEKLAGEFGGKAVLFSDFASHLKDTDIVIASTASPKFIIKPDDLKSALKVRGAKPMFFIDISVPRNIDPRINDLDSVYLYDIDDLQEVIAANLKEREKEAAEAEKLILGEIDTFYTWVKSLDVVPTIVALRENLDKIRKNELEKALSQLNGLSEKDKKVIDSMTSAIVNKVMHRPVKHLKGNASGVDSDFFVAAVRKLFDLGDIKIENEAKEEDKEKVTS